MSVDINKIPFVMIGALQGQAAGFTILDVLGSGCSFKRT
jgi:hypothetical protein